jgi:acyl-CoA hydrolase
MTSRAYLTFVAIDREGRRIAVPPLKLETEVDNRRALEAHARRAERLSARKRLRDEHAQVRPD